MFLHFPATKKNKNFRYILYSSIKNQILRKMPTLKLKQFCKTLMPKTIKIHHVYGLANHNELLSRFIYKLSEI